MSIQFLVHDAADTVGVVVVEDVQAGQALAGWVMETDETIRVEARDPIPLGHKLALRDLGESETVVKYGHDIGRTTAKVAKGGHVHVHNTRTKRW